MLIAAPMCMVLILQVNAYVSLLELIYTLIRQMQRHKLCTLWLSVHTKSS